MVQSKEERKESKREWWRKNPNYNKEYYHKNKERENKRLKGYREENNEKILQYSRDYRKNNPEKVNKINRAWLKNNPEKRKLYDLKKKESRKDWGIEPINEYFENSHFHHLHVDENHSVGIYVPGELHNSIWHSHKDQESMNKINKAVIKWYN